MKKKQAKRNRRFVVGVMFIIGSIAYGWIGLFACNAIGIKYGYFWVVLGWGIYAVSWITYGLGFILAGSAGVQFAKGLFRKIFKRNKKQKIEEMPN